MMNLSASSSRNPFATGTPATLPVLERNREIEKPQLQKMELFVVRVVPWALSGAMCHRSGYEPPVLQEYNGGDFASS